nr:MAG TPA: nucelotide kinase [Caudoviricetes sp.]
MGLIKDKFEKKPEGTTPGGRSIASMGIARYPFHPIDDKSKEIVEEKEDMVNHPKHYKIEGISEEVIDICEAMIKDVTKETDNPVLASHIAVVIQYVMRAHKKNGKEDYKKAIWYLNRAIASMEGE